MAPHAAAIDAAIVAFGRDRLRGAGHNGPVVNRRAGEWCKRYGYALFPPLGQHKYIEHFYPTGVVVLRKNRFNEQELSVRGAAR